MFQDLFTLTFVFCCGVCFADDPTISSKPLGQLGGSIIKEPKYESTPNYCLMLLDVGGETKVWMVEDGRRLFVDKNANGDLTDDGPPINAQGRKSSGSQYEETDYLLDVITPADGSRHTHFALHRWNYGAQEASYGLSLSIGGKLPVYAGWFGTFWSSKSESAPILHLAGPFTPSLLRSREFSIAPGRKRMDLVFINRGSGRGAEAYLSIDALPADMVPRLQVEWPMGTGVAPLQTLHPLQERCCYWDFYTKDFEVPTGVVEGKATVSVEFSNGQPPMKLTTREIRVPVVAPAASSESAPDQSPRKQ